MLGRRRKGSAEIEPEGPPFPDGLEYLWGWFWDIHAGRTINGMSHTRPTHVDVLAWQWNRGIRLAPWEAQAIYSLGSAWVRIMSADSGAPSVDKEPDDGPKKPRKKGAPARSR